MSPFSFLLFDLDSRIGRVIKLSALPASLPTFIDLAQPPVLIEIALSANPGSLPIAAGAGTGMHRMRVKGFTLVELLVTMAIVAILLAVAFPSFQGSFRSNRIAAANNELISSLSLARTEAIKSTRSSGLCAANAAGTACVNGVDWSNGWLVWTNSAASANRDYEAGVDTLVRQVQARPGIVMNVAAGTAAAPMHHRIVFDSRGRALGTPSGSDGGRVISITPDTCPAGQRIVSEVTLTQVGQVNSSKELCP